MEGVLNVESNHWLCVGLSFLTLVLGLMIGLRFRQVICKTLQPVIHKYNIHHLIPVKEDTTNSFYKSLEVKKDEVKKEEVKEDEVKKKD
jgi:hypothetical protein